MFLLVYRTKKAAQNLKLLSNLKSFAAVRSQSPVSGLQLFAIIFSRNVFLLSKRYILLTESTELNMKK